MLSMSVPWWELILRALIVYGFLIVLLRVTGKRQVGQLAPFDLVLPADALERRAGLNQRRRQFAAGGTGVGDRSTSWGRLTT